MYQLSGTDAERLAYTMTGVPILSTWEITSGSGQGNVYTWGGAAWVQTSTGGASHITDPAYSLVKYSGSGYTYLCEAAIGTARSTAAWRVLRITDATGDMVYAGTVGTTAGTFAFAGTSLAVVAALTYTLGA